MTLPSSGKIRMSDINQELGKDAHAKITLNDSDARGIAGISSGTIRLSDFYGKSAYFTLNIGSGQISTPSGNHNAAGFFKNKFGSITPINILGSEFTQLFCDQTISGETQMSIYPGNNIPDSFTFSTVNSAGDVNNTGVFSKRTGGNVWYCTNYNIYAEISAWVGSSKRFKIIMNA